MDMAANQNGNLRGVFLNLAHRADAATERYRRDGFEAEIVPGCPALWHIVVTYASHEKIAAAHLVGRGFGVYLPERDKAWFTRGVRRQRRIPLYPNYLFLFVWDIERHLRRIHACTGVMRILLAGDKPAVVPDSVIDEMQATEFNQTELPSDWRSTPLKKKRRRRRGRGERAPEEPEADGPITISTYNALVDISLDASERISALHKALGLPS